MQLFSIENYNYTADVIGYETIDNVNGEGRTKVYGNPIPIELNMTSNSLGELIIYTKAEIQLDAYLSSLRSKNPEWGKVDPSRNAVLLQRLVYPIGTPSGAIWTIVNAQPILDPWGNFVNYKYRGQLIVPTRAAVTVISQTDIDKFNRD